MQYRPCSINTCFIIIANIFPILRYYRYNTSDDFRNAKPRANTDSNSEILNIDSNKTTNIIKVPKGSNFHVVCSQKEIQHTDGSSEENLNKQPAFIITIHY